MIAYLDQFFKKGSDLCNGNQLLIFLFGRLYFITCIVFRVHDLVGLTLSTVAYSLVYRFRLCYITILSTTLDAQKKCVLLAVFFG